MDANKIKENIYRETLRIMFAVENASDENFSNIKNVDDYKDKMEGALERAIVRVCQAKKAGIKRIALIGKDYDKIEEGLDLIKDKNLNDIMQIDRLSIKRPNRALEPYNEFYTLDYKTIVIEQGIRNDETIYVHYYPSFVGVEELRHDVLAIIPYFIKSELYEEDEASLAMNARNIFEAQLQAIEMDAQTVQTRVQNVFGRYN